jgi:N-acetylmuramoyl-L-alanine amidase
MITTKLGIYLLCFMLFWIPQVSFAAKIVIDAGHGGSDPGAIGVNGLKEKDVNLDIAKRVRDQLSSQGYEIIMTRSNDTFLSLAERVGIADWARPDLFVSIHANAHPQSHIKGSLILYYDNRYPQKRYPASTAMAKITPHSRELAQTVLDSILQNAGTENRGLVPSSAYLVRMGNVPSILVETAFLSNGSDAEKLANEQYKEAFAIGITEGITRYYPINFRDVTSHWAKLSIKKMKDTGLMVGYGNTFRPNQPITRAELLATLDRVFYFTQIQPPLASEGDADEAISDETETSTENSKQQEEAISDESLLEPTDPSEEPTVRDVQISSAEVIDSHKKLPEVDMNDMTEDHWAYAIFQKAAQLGIIEGYPDGTIRPNHPVSRAEASVLFDRIQSLSKQMEPFTITEPLFTDVPINTWSSQSIYRMKTASLIHGTTATTFAPKKQMTRAEISVILDRYID